MAFDLDGTLIDSRRDLADSANALIVERGGAPLDVESVTRMVGEGAAVLVRRALTAAGLSADDPSALPRFLELYDARLLVHTRAYEGIPEALDVVGRSARLAVLTNKPQHQSEAVLRGLHLIDRFEWIIGGDTAFGRKPEPGGLLDLARRANVDVARALLVGDSAIDLRTARAAGSRICIVRYGFGFRFAEPELRGDELVAATPADLALLAS
ncbi:MAG: HAD-IA family hydrolase [Vicinamibacterales bacterium]